MVVRLAGEKFEREAGGFRVRSMSRFVGRREGDDRIKPLTLQSFAVELGFAARSREVALGEGEKWGEIFGRASLGLDGGDARPPTARPYVVRGAFEIQTDKMLAFQPITGNPLEPPIGRIQGAVDHGVHRLAETFVVKAHALGERAEQLDI